MTNVSHTLVNRLAAYFVSRPGVWLDGRRLAQIAGNYAWRTRVSDLRRAPFLMTIENRQRRARTPQGSYVVSEYRFVPASAEIDG
jgi:hypothetical protein